MKTNPIQKTLTKARDLILKHGWVQYQFGNKKIGYCAIGAIRTATSSHTRRFGAETTLDATFKDGTGTIISYNDSPKRRKSHIVAKFNKAIKLAEKTK
jgi:hypothetical protein